MLTATVPVEARQVARDGIPVVGDIGLSVEPRVQLDERLEIRTARERRVAVAIDPDDLGRDPLADLRLVAGLGEDDQPAVAVQVDEPGGDDLAAGIDPAAGARALTLRGIDQANSVAIDPDRRRPPGRPGAVDDGPAFDDDVERLVQPVLLRLPRLRRPSWHHDLRAIRPVVR